MGRVKIYFNEEDKKNARIERSRRHYEKYKDIDKEMYRLSACRSYYRKRLKENPKKSIYYNQKIDELTKQLEELKSNKPNN